ncbi:MAG TPA: energy transducer TonB [Longimicrobium sp.]
MKSLAVPILVALACAATPLRAQDVVPGTLIPVARTPDGIVLSLDSASIARTGDSTFYATAVYEFPPEVAARAGVDRRFETQETDCAESRYRGRAVTFMKGDLPVDVEEGDTTGRAEWRPVDMVDLPIHRVLCARLLGSFAALPVTTEIWSVEQQPELVNRDAVARSIAREFPPRLRDAGTSGNAILRFRIDAEGRVDTASMRVLRATLAEFGEAARRVALRMRFRPARLRGEPVAVWVTLPVTFQLMRGSP